MHIGIYLKQKIYSNYIMTSNITPENYIFRFGKYINQRADQVAKIYKVDKKIRS